LILNSSAHSLANSSVKITTGITKIL